MTVPDGLGPAGQALKRGILADLGPEMELTPREMTFLEQAAQIADHVAELERIVARDGVTTIGSRHQTVIHPAVQEVRQQRLALLRLLQALKLDDEAAAEDTPATARARHAAQARWSRQSQLEARRAAKGA